MTETTDYYAIANELIEDLKADRLRLLETWKEGNIRNANDTARLIAELNQQIAAVQLLAQDEAPPRRARDISA